MIIVLMQNYGFKCIAKEADLMCELLRRGAHPVHDYLIEQSRTMRMCALSLMNCTSDNSVSASAVMLVRACLKNPLNIIIHPIVKPMIPHELYGPFVKLYNIFHPFLRLSNCTLHNFVFTTTLSAQTVYRRVASI